MRAKDVLQLLADKHSGDVFVPECKTGPTHGEKFHRMDAWAMKRSWAHPHTWGYEIKVSRSDFLGDDKWHNYLPYCSHFAFVTAPGVCDPKEVPDGCGLIVVTSTGTRLLTKRKAPMRDVTIPEELWRYVLMSRSLIQERDIVRYGMPEDQAGYWRRWLDRKRENQEIGHGVSRRLPELYRENVVTVETENRRLRREVEKYADLAKMLQEMGIGIHEYYCNEQIREAINNRHNVITDQMQRTAKHLVESAQKLAESLSPPAPQPQEPKE